MKAFKRAESLPRAEEMLKGSLKKEQRALLAYLLKKYGNTWEPWKTKLSKFRNKGEELMKEAK
ncbi:hypothetical protein E1B28_007193 [Marasmius oreades]|uniref:Uncharacterized protein n=1 Tax=Marasmius oreades TaxID=181124 RepID=A0A9P7S140_9AGAR|nr:uncharacterized protein E1B28_007193 [Marasmius oreades]KAG7093519.1 hypothetical protein E1B28_007193 [Marasmius oreades]